MINYDKEDPIFSKLLDPDNQTHLRVLDEDNYQLLKKSEPSIYFSSSLLSEAVKLLGAHLRTEHYRAKEQGFVLGRITTEK